MSDLTAEIRKLVTWKPASKAVTLHGDIDLKAGWSTRKPRILMDLMQNKFLTAAGELLHLEDRNAQLEKELQTVLRSTHYLDSPEHIPDPKVRAELQLMRKSIAAILAKSGE